MLFQTSVSAIEMSLLLLDPSSGFFLLFAMYAFVHVYLVMLGEGLAQPVDNLRWNGCK